VIDFTHVLAGPFCTRLLADFGADVARIESSKHPDSPWRTVKDPNLDRDVAYLVVNRNKRSVTINLKTEAGRELAARIAGVADVLVENFSAGVLDRVDLGYERLSAMNPRLVYVSMSGYGHSGPRRDWTSMNSNLQAYSGLMMSTGSESDPPISISNSWMDYVGGLHACFGIIQALSRRAVSGVGMRLDLSQFECGVSTIGPALMASAASRERPRRAGNRAAGAAPQGCYRCAGKDEWCAISVQTDEQWRALAQVMGFAPDSRFDSVLGRLKHHDEIDRLITAWTETRDKPDVEGLLKAAGVPAERMRRANEVAPDSSQPAGPFKPMSGPHAADVLFTTMPLGLSPATLAEPRSAGRLGEHTDDVLRSWLGMDNSEIEALRRAEVLA